jgi:Protein of unknown function (DUF1569)
MKKLDNLKDKWEILRRLEIINPNAKGLWGRMSAHQMICHLKDCFQMALGEKKVKQTGNIFHKTIVKWIALNLPIPVPKNRPTLPEVNQEIGGTLPSDFAKDLADLVKLIERFESRADGFDAVEHPILGKLSANEWARWGYLHTDHHLRQFGV